jgi:hypothetical protein
MRIFLAVLLAFQLLIGSAVAGPKQGYYYAKVANFHKVHLEQVERFRKIGTLSEAERTKLMEEDWASLNYDLEVFWESVVKTQDYLLKNDRSAWAILRNEMGNAIAISELIGSASSLAISSVERNDPALMERSIEVSQIVERMIPD